MKVWIDAQIAPALAVWFARTLGTEARSVRDLGLRDATDQAIFFAARAADAIVLTKDADFVRLLESHGPPPRIVWLTIGNTTNDRLRALLLEHWSRVTTAFDGGEALFEITGSTDR